MPQPVHIQKVVSYATLITFVLFFGGGIYFVLDRFVINPSLSSQELDVATKSVKFEVAPDFQFTDMQGKTHRLSDFSNKIVILNFWASWCNPCIEEFPSLHEFIKRNKEHVVLIAVSEDRDLKSILDFAKTFKVEFNDSLLMSWDVDGRIAKEYGVFKLPDSFLLAKGNKFVKKVSGIRNWMSPAARREIDNLEDRP